MRRLIAKRNILYLSQMYQPKDELPTNDQGIIAAWLAAGSAQWADEEPLEKPMPEIKNPDSGAGGSDLDNGGADPAGETPPANAPEPPSEPPALAKLTVPELRKQAAALGIDSSGAKNKEQLIALLAAGGAE